MSDFTPHDAQFTGRKMLLIIVSFFGVIIAVNGTMLTLAVQSFGGLVVGNSYVASQHFNDDVAAARSQPIHKWHLELAAGPDDVTLELRDRDGTPIEGLDLSLSIDRPTHERDTAALRLIEQSPGKYRGDVSLAPGQWIGTLTTAKGQTRSVTFKRARATQ